MDRRTALVTGGASGIGLGMAEAMLGRGMNVVIADVRDDHLDRARESLGGADGRLMMCRLDVTDKGAWMSGLDRIDERFGGVDVLCLNAGIGVLGTILDSRPADWNWLMGVNLQGVTNGLEMVVPRMRSRGTGGHVVATSSAGGLMVARDGGIYSSAKFGVIAAMDCLRAELEPEGIGVTTLCPAGVNTNIHDHETMRPARYLDSGVRGDDAQLAAEQQQAREMLSKGADPRDVGKQVLRAIDENAAIVFTDGGIAPIVEMRRDALARGSSQPRPGVDATRGSVVLAELAGESVATRVLEARGYSVKLLDQSAVDSAREEPGSLPDPGNDSPLVLALAPQVAGRSEVVDWTKQVNDVLRRCFTVIRGLVPNRLSFGQGGRLVAVLPSTALFADPARCADSVVGRSCLGLIEGLAAELRPGPTVVTIVFTEDDEDEASLGLRIDSALHGAGLFSFPAGDYGSRVRALFLPWLDALSRTSSDTKLPPLGPMGEVYRRA